MVTDRSRRRAWTLGVSTLIVVTLLYMTVGIISGLRSVANLVITPFSWTIDVVARPMGHLFAGAINYSDVVAQNERLRYELGRAQLRADETWALQRQLSQLTTQLHVPFVGSLQTVAAQVVSISPTNFSATFDISKGRDSGILAGMPVVANGGLVGSVISTTPRGATIRLITDVASSVGVTFGNGHQSIVISGGGVNNGLSATAVDLKAALPTGTILTTDGLSGGLYPPGLPVARVSTVRLTPGATTYNVTVAPTADLRHLFYVDVVLWEPTS